MKKKIYLAMLAVCFELTASACGDGVLLSQTVQRQKELLTERKQRQELRVLCLLRM